MINQIIEGFKVTADMVKVNWSFGEDTFLKLLEIRNSAGEVVASWVTNFDKIPAETFETILDHLMG